MRAFPLSSKLVMLEKSPSKNLVMHQMKQDMVTRDNVIKTAHMPKVVTDQPSVLLNPDAQEFRNLMQLITPVLEQCTQFPKSTYLNDLRRY